MSKRSSSKRRRGQQEQQVAPATQVVAASAPEPQPEPQTGVVAVPVSSERTSSVPPETLQAYDDMVRSTAAVLESLRIRVPAALAERVRRSSVPPPPDARQQG